MRSATRQRTPRASSETLPVSMPWAGGLRKPVTSVAGTCARLAGCMHFAHVQPVCAKNMCIALHNKSLHIFSKNHNTLKICVFIVWHALC